VFKRAFWLTVGTGLGVGASLWVSRRVRRYGPAGVAKAARALQADVRAALADGRVAMREREAELRRALSQPPDGGAPRP
jgi:hypothetical protein